MAARRLVWWQKVGFLAPMSGLVVGWAATMPDAQPAVTADDTTAASAGLRIEVPTEPLEQPANVRPMVPGTSSGASGRAASTGIVSASTLQDVPVTAMLAYRRAKTLLAEADPGCHLSWSLVAAIGRVESDHGRFGGSTVEPDGKVEPGIYGVPLDGGPGLATIRDSDGGAIDKDPVFDRAVGPMQFIPATWAAVGVDANADGTKDPQNVYDAAAATGIYLCSGGGNLARTDQARAAVKRYNNSDSYAATVLALARAYALNDREAAAAALTAPIESSADRPATLTKEQVRKASRDRTKVAEHPSKPHRPGSETGTPSNPEPPSPGPSNPTPSQSPSPTASQPTGQAPSTQAPTTAAPGVPTTPRPTAALTQCAPVASTNVGPSATPASPACP